MSNQQDIKGLHEHIKESTGPLIKVVSDIAKGSDIKTKDAVIKSEDKTKKDNLKNNTWNNEYQTSFASVYGKGIDNEKDYLEFAGPAIRAINGKLKQFYLDENNKALPDIVYNKVNLTKVIKEFKDASWTWAKDLKNYNLNKTQANVDKLKISQELYLLKYEQMYQKNLNNFEQKGIYFLDHKALYKKEFDKQNPQGVVNYNKYNSETNFKPKGAKTLDWSTQELGDIYKENPYTGKGYKTVSTIMKDNKGDLNAEMNLVNRTWVSNYLSEGGNKNKMPDEKLKGMDMVVDMLTYIQKYGTAYNKNPQDKKTAAALLAGYNNPSNQDKFKFFNDSKEIINGLTNRMGYYGNRNLFKKYNESMGLYAWANSVADGQKNIDKDILLSEITNEDDFEKLKKSIALDAKQKFINGYKDIVIDDEINQVNQKDFSILVNHLVDEKGMIRGFDEFRSLVNADKKIMGSVNYAQERVIVGKNPATGQPIYGIPPISQVQKPVNKQFLNDNSKLYQLGYAQNNSYGWNQAERAFGNFTGIFGIDSYSDDKEQFAKDYYSYLTGQYKKKYDNVEIAKLKGYEDSKIRKIVDRVNPQVSYPYVNLENNDGRLDNQEGSKQINVQKIFNLVLDENGSGEFITENDERSIKIFNNKETLAGLNVMTIDDIEDDKENNAAKLNSFFSGDNLDGAQMTFYRNTNIEDFSRYEFSKNIGKDKDGKIKREKINIFIKQDLLEDADEDFFRATSRSTGSLNFETKGFKNMMIYQDNNDQGKNKYKEAKMTYDSATDSFILNIEYEYPSGSENMENYSYSMSNASAIGYDDAYKLFDERLKELTIADLKAQGKWQNSIDRNQ